MLTSSIPWEIWHPIFRDVYDHECAAFPSHLEDPTYVLSPLHQRVLIHRNLSLVSEHFHRVSSSIFYEELDLSTPESLHAISKVMTKNPGLAPVVRRLSFNFKDYRCGASVPRIPRERKKTQIEPCPPDSDPIGQAEWRVRRSVSLSNTHERIVYGPSGTRQSQHWVGWTGLIRTILSTCTGLLHVSINATANYEDYAKKPTARSYRTLFGSPDLVHNDALLNGLRVCTNLRSLELIDPSPIDRFGSALGDWTRLERASITISKSYPEARRLSEATFSPPFTLRSFTLINLSRYVSTLPTTSNLSRCPDLQELELGELDLSSTPTVMAAQFLINAYSHSLVRLKIAVRPGVRDVSVILRHGAIQFPNLKTLVLAGGECHIYLFSALTTPVLEDFEVRSLRVHGIPTQDDNEGAPMPVEDFLTTPIWSSHGWQRLGDPAEDAYWHSFFSLPCMTAIRRFRVLAIAPNAKLAMRRVAHNRGIITKDVALAGDAQGDDVNVGATLAGNGEAGAPAPLAGVWAMPAPGLMAGGLADLNPPPDVAAHEEAAAPPNQPTIADALIHATGVGFPSAAQLQQVWANLQPGALAQEAIEGMDEGGNDNGAVAGDHLGGLEPPALYDTIPEEDLDGEDAEN